MFQKFHVNNLESNFIKELLHTEYIPKLNYVKDDSIIIEGCFYIYNQFIIRCESTGVFKGVTTAGLYPSDKLYPSAELFPCSPVSVGIYKIVDYFNKNVETCYKYMSNRSYYDSQTHLHLGNYLRYIRDEYDINLMPYYNCFNGSYVTNVTLDNSNLHYQESENNYRVVSIPIKFNTTYTIAISSYEGVKLRGFIYDDTHGNIRNVSGDGIDYYSDYTDLVNSYRYISSTFFHKPFTYRIETSNRDLYERESSLRLLLQFSTKNESSIVVLEGEYSLVFPLKSADRPAADSLEFLDFELYPSLLRFNSKESYAFSGRLIEYLLGNVIDSQSPYSKDISSANSAISQIMHNKLMLNFAETDASKGMWNDYLKSAVKKIVEKYHVRYGLVDQDGFINSDLELVLHREGKYRQ